MVWGLPRPQVGPGRVLVRNHSSLVSAGISLASSGQGLTLRNCEADNWADGGIVATSPMGTFSDVTVESRLIHHNNAGLKAERSATPALGRTAVASSTYRGLPASAATDGHVLTGWSSLFSDKEWTYVDLGSVSTIHQIVLRWEAA